jgi:hypothetical protein
VKSVLKHRPKSTEQARRKEISFDKISQACRNQYERAHDSYSSGKDLKSDEQHEKHQQQQGEKQTECRETGGDGEHQKFPSVAAPSGAHFLFGALEVFSWM